MIDHQAHSAAGSVNVRARDTVRSSFASQHFPRLPRFSVAFLLLPWLLIIFLPTYYPGLMWFGLLTFTVTTLRRLEAGLYAFLALGPLQLLVRSANQLDLVLGVWYELLFLILLADWLLRTMRNKLPMSAITMSRFIFIVLLFFGFQALRSSSASVGLLGLRESFRFLLLFPVVASIVSWRRECARGLLYSMVLGIGLLAALQGYSYLSGWTPFPERPITTPEIVRTIAGYPLERMIPFTFGGIAGFVDTVGPFIWVTALLGIFEVRNRWIWLSLAIGLTVLCILTVSYTLLIVLVVGAFILFVILWQRKIRQHKVPLVVFASLLIVPLLILLVSGEILGVGVVGEPMSLYDRIKGALWVYTEPLPLDDPVAFLIGYGLRFRGGALLMPAGGLSDEVNLVDASWAAIVYMVGIPAAICIAVWFGRVLVKGIRAYISLERNQVGPPHERLTLLVAIVGYAASFASVHTTPWMLFGGPDSNFVALAAIVASLAHSPRRRDISGRSQNSIYVRKHQLQTDVSARISTI